MIFVLDTAVGLGVWLPFTFGKSTALLSVSPRLSLTIKPNLTFQQLDPRRALQVLHWPIRVIRVVTDPVVDSIFLVIGYLILPSIVRMLDGSFTAGFWALSTFVPGDVLEKSARFVGTSVRLPLLL
jgi:E3 ubiquitin-protein ligase MARCH6